MKTKSWTPPASLANVDAENARFEMLEDAYLSIDGSPLRGPLPLFLCMHKALDMSRFARNIELHNGRGDVLLDWTDRQLTGDAAFIKLFEQLHASAVTYYRDLTEAVRYQLEQELGIRSEQLAEDEDRRR